ncbi:MAG: two-component response regulator [Flavipsychrobacter sp.]|nr:two-component response regulator [Flavipsychrobacter sp.]
MARNRILLADDDQEDRLIISDSFKEIGQSECVVFVENGEEVMHYLNKLTDMTLLPSLIVLDLNMPKMNGTETLRVLKKHDNFRHIHVIIFSTSVNEKEKKECMELGALDYITKPIKYQESIAIATRFFEYTK